MRNIAFTPKALDDFVAWASENKKIHARIADFLKDIRRNPFSGIGKPETLKHDLKSLWSRRISDEHRLVYEVKDREIIIHSCRYHYKK